MNTYDYEQTDAVFTLQFAHAHIQLKAKVRVHLTALFDHKPLAG